MPELTPALAAAVCAVAFLAAFVLRRIVGNVPRHFQDRSIVASLFLLAATNLLDDPGIEHVSSR